MLAVRFNVLPKQSGLLLLAVGAAGIGFTTTVTVPDTPVHPATVAVTEYVPEAATVAAAIVGFCKVEEKLFGPVHEYVAPAIVLAVRVNVEPAHKGLLLPAVGATGLGLTTTTVVPAGPGHPATVAVTEYVPDAAVVAPAIEGFCVEEEKLFGPVHEYVAPAMVLAVKFNVKPAQIGLLLLAAGAAGAGLTVTIVVPAEPVQPAMVAVTEYVPEAATVAAAIVGFCEEEEKLLGPVQEYVAPATVVAVKFNAVPAQIGLLLLAVGVAGIGFTVTAVVPAGPVQPATIAVTE